MIQTTVTINSEPSTVADAYAAIQDAIGSSHPRWVAAVDDYSYISSANNLIIGAVGSPHSSSGVVFRSDASYDRFRVFAATATTACSLPTGTVFKVFIFPES